MKKLFKIVASCVIFASLSVRAFGGAINPTSISDSLAPYDITSAWDFQLTQSFQVTALGYYDSGSAGGLLTSHQVGLWKNDGTLLVSATIPAGTAASLIGSYRYVPITSIILAPGFYEVGGFVPGGLDKYVYDATGTTQPGILYYVSHVATGSFAFPGGQFLVSTKEFTANFETHPVVNTAVPEPNTAALISTGVAGLLLFMRRRIGGRNR